MLPKPMLTSYHSRSHWTPCWIYWIGLMLLHRSVAANAARKLVMLPFYMQGVVALAG